MGKIRFGKVCKVLLGIAGTAYAFKKDHWFVGTIAGIYTLDALDEVDE